MARNSEAATETIKPRLRAVKRKRAEKETKLEKSENASSDNPENPEACNESETLFSLAKDLSRACILQCISAIFHLTEEQLRGKKELFEGEHQPVFLQVTCIRVPKTPRRQIRMLLPHPLLSPEDDVALFVCDLQRGRRKNPEPTVHRYEELLSKHKCSAVKTVIPLNQVRTEYDQYELKRSLVNSYDGFLVDGRIAGHMAHLLGKEFYKRRKLPIPIRMNVKNLAREIDYALRKTSLSIHSFGDTHLMQVGNTGMKKEHLADNVMVACQQLNKNYPGGWENVRAVRIKTPKSPSIPIYVTLKNKNLVQTPVVQPRRPKAYRTLEGELTTLEKDSNVLVSPEGTVTLKLTRKRKRKPRGKDSSPAPEELSD